MRVLQFETQAPIAASDPQRVDVACFVGFVAHRPGALPPALHRWLEARGWLTPPFGRTGADALLDVPVPIDAWETFDRLFAWDQRHLDGRGPQGPTYLGAAVRSFFAEGGRRCYVVRVGDPWAVNTPRSHRLAAIARLLPGYPVRLAVAATDRQTWRGVGHLFGLPDVSFLCLPDLPDAVGVEPPEREPVALPPGPPEQFVECSQATLPPPPSDRLLRHFQAPRCDPQGYRDWARVLRDVGNLLARHRREVQLVAALPIPAAVGDGIPADALEVQTAFVQLTYPWLRTPASVDLPEGLESPEGALLGLLARNALSRGTFRSAAHLPLREVYDVAPRLRREHAWQAQTHLSLFGLTPGGLTLQSDVTTSPNPSYRPASVNRLVAVLLRAARRLGEDMVFEPAGEALWSLLRERLRALLLGLLQAGALRGDTPEAAFQVRCDRSTMSQHDIDNGRIIVQVQFQAAYPIATLTVVLAMTDGGQVSLVPAPPETQEAA